MNNIPINTSILIPDPISYHHRFCNAYPQPPSTTLNHPEGRMREGLWGQEAPLQSVAIISPRTNAQSSSSIPSSSSTPSPSQSTPSLGREDGAAVYRTDQRSRISLTHLSLHCSLQHPLHTIHPLISLVF